MRNHSPSLTERRLPAQFIRFFAVLALVAGLIACGGGGDSATESSAIQRQQLAAVTSVAPQTGVWWNPSASGSGYGIEVQGAQLSLTIYQYDLAGQATWFAGILAQQADGSYAGPISSFGGGQTLTGAYKAPTGATLAGTATLSFTTASAGTLVLQPTGANTPVTVAIQRFSFSNPAFSSPSSRFQSGVWWAPSQSGRGYFIESQGNQVSIGSYMYDDAGKPIWYTLLTSLQTDGVTAIGSLLQFANGQTLTGPYKSPVLVNANVGSVNFVATSSTTANLTLPNGSTVALTRFLFDGAAPANSSVTLTSVPSSSFFGGVDTVVALPYATTATASASVTCIGSVCPSSYNVATFKLRASGRSYSVGNLTAVNTTTGSSVIPVFSGLSNGQVIADGETASFTLQSPFTSGATVNLVYSFTIVETAQTFSYTVRLTTN